MFRGKGDSGGATQITNKQGKLVLPKMAIPGLVYSLTVGTKRCQSCQRSGQSLTPYYFVFVLRLKSKIMYIFQTEMAELYTKLLQPLKYLEVINGNPEGWEYSRIDLVKAFYNLLRTQRDNPEEDRAIFITTFSGLFGEAPAQLNPKFLSLDERSLRQRIDDPQTAIVTAVLHMESLIYTARVSGSPKDLENVNDFVTFLGTVEEASISQDGLALPVHYRRAISEATKFVVSNPMKKLRLDDSSEMQHINIDWNDIISEEENNILKHDNQKPTAVLLGKDDTVDWDFIVFNEEDRNENLFSDSPENAAIFIEEDTVENAFADSPVIDISDDEEQSKYY